MNKSHPSVAHALVRAASRLVSTPLPAAPKSMQLVRLLLISMLPIGVSAQDARLDALRATLSAIRAHSGTPDIRNYGARPELTTAKHQLRDWIESQLGSFKNFQHKDEFSYRINEALKVAKLTESSDQQSLLGSLGTVRMSDESGLLIITTAVGILCQYDESAYAYRNVDGRWVRIWESEQDDYAPKKYSPQYLTAVHAWEPRGDRYNRDPSYILTLGNNWGCGSSWHSVNYRLWRVDSHASKLLLDRSESAWLRTDTYIVGSIGRDWLQDNPPIDVLIEFTEGSIDAGVHNREAVRHFLIRGDQIKRADPVALSPRDFVDEWLTRPWNESADWSSSPALREWHRKLHADFVAARFLWPTSHCQTPDLWQVALVPLDIKNFQEQPTVYFLIRWRPPYHFTMVNIRDKPWSRCTEEDPGADQWRTLFSTQDWRW